MGGHRAGHACARACRCNRVKQSYLVIENFVGASLLPTPDRMGEAQPLTIGLDPRPMMARPPPCFPVRKIVPSLKRPFQNWLSGVQLIEQRLRVLQIARIEALGETPVNRSQQFARLLNLAPVAPEARKTHGGAQFPGFGLLLM